MTDFAKLVMEVDTRPLKQAVTELGNVTKASQQAGEAADEQAKRFMRLHDKMFPEKAKAREYKADLEALNEAHRRGVISAEEHARAVKQLGVDTDSMAFKVGNAFKKMLPALTVTAIVGGFAAMTRSAINMADEMTKAAQQVGVGVAELSRLRHAADLSGVSFDGLKSSIGIMNRNLVDLNGGGNAATKALAQMGIAARGTDGKVKSTTQIMTEMADVFQRMPDGAEKSALAMAVFGRSGAQLIPMLNQGADAIREVMGEADELGIVLDEETGRRAEAFNDNLTLLGRVVQGLGMQIASDMLPMLVSFTDWLVKNGKAALDAVRALFDVGRGVVIYARQLFDAINSTQGFSNAISWVADRLRWLRDRVGELLAPLGKLIKHFRSVGAAAREAEGRTNPFGASTTNLANALGGSGAGSLSNSAGRSARAINDNEKAARDAAREFQNLARQVEQLERRLNPLTARSQDLQRNLELLREAQRQGLRTAEEIRSTANLLFSEYFGPEAERAINDNQRMMDQAADKIRDSMMKKADAVRDGTQQIARDFAQMSFQVAGSIDMLGRAISSGNILGILGGVANLGNQLTGLGTFFGGAKAGTAGAAAGGGSAATGLLGGAGLALSSFGAGFSAAAGGFLTGGLAGAKASVAAAGAAAKTGLAKFAVSAGAIAAPIAAAAATIMGIIGSVKHLDSGLHLVANQFGTGVHQFDVTRRDRMFGAIKGGRRTAFTAAGSAVADPIVQAVDAIQESVVAAAAQLGVGAEVFDNFVHRVQFSLKGLSEEQALARVNEELGKLGDKFAALIPGISSVNELMAVVQQRYDLETRKLQLLGDETELLRRQREAEFAATHELNHELLKLVHSLEDAAMAAAKAEQAAQELAQEQARIAQERFNLETRLLQLQGDTAELRRRELEALDPTNRELQNLIWNLEDAAVAANQAARAAQELAQAQARIAQERFNLEGRLLQLQGNTMALRQRELDAIDESNRDILKSIFALQDAQAAAAEAERERQRIANERENLERQILQLQGNTVELRRRELEALDPSNRALQQFVWSLEDAKAVLDGLNERDFANVVDFRRAQAQARLGLGVTPSGPTFAGGNIPMIEPARGISASPPTDATMRALVDEVKQLRDEQRQLNIQTSNSTDRTYRLLRSWDAVGLPQERAA